jgi:aminopeptidase N
MAKDGTQMKRLVQIQLLIVTLAISLSAQHLPTGTYRPNRERTYDIIHYKADIKIDWTKKRILGESTIRLRQLKPGTSVSLDAYWLSVKSVKELPSGKAVKFASTDSTLVVTFDRTLKETDTTSVVIQYAATPNAGLYFVDRPAGNRTVQTIFTYGEGGIHANWLPIYNEPNDKFSSEMVVTVPKEDQAISNGKLLETTNNSDGTRTFHWYQSLPHSNYLIALFVGEYVPVKLRSAFDQIPLTVWTLPGTEPEAYNVFTRTPDMVEFFSNRFNFRFPWDKYDQVAVYDYAIGAMENTSITGANDRELRKLGQTEEFGPDFEYYTSNWTQETLISHELAHHWFGDNLTCTSLASIWLNESFASYLMMLWDEHRLGREYLRSQTWLALQKYLRYVQNEHIIRPLEYRYFDSRDEIYNDETTYLKGGIVLNMLRWILGDDDFFKGMAHYLDKHKFSNVESSDLQIALEESTGKKLDWFFNQWVYGGGHPTFEVRWNYLPGRKKVEVSVDQIQPIIQGQGLFKLPVELRVDAGGKSSRTTVWVEKEHEVFYFDAEEKPAMVSFDGRGVLVCDMKFEKEIDELVYQVATDDLPGKLWAMHQLVERFPFDPKTGAALNSALDSKAGWPLRAEAVYLLQHVPTTTAQALLAEQARSSDYHLRKAAVLALGFKQTTVAQTILRRIAETDPNDDVAATAFVAFARSGSPLSPDTLRQYLNKQSWHDVKRLAALRVMETAGSATYVPLIKESATMRYNYEIRSQALSAWAACAPTDPGLVDALIWSAKNDILRVRSVAIGLLAKLKIDRALPVLREISMRNGDIDIRKFARDAIEAIQRVPK